MASGKNTGCHYQSFLCFFVRGLSITGAAFRGAQLATVFIPVILVSLITEYQPIVLYINNDLPLPVHFS
jgi:hypothetical protein